MHTYIQRFPNQKMVTVKREKSSEKNYFRINNDSFFAAVKNLTPSATIIYCFLINSKDGFQYPLSSAVVKDITGYSRSTYNRAIKELIEKGYLVQPDQEVNNWVLYEMPHSKE